MANYRAGEYVDLDEHEVLGADGTRVTEARADVIVEEVLGLLAESCGFGSVGGVGWVR